MLLFFFEDVGGKSVRKFHNYFFFRQFRTLTRRHGARERESEVEKSTMKNVKGKYHFRVVNGNR